MDTASEYNKMNQGFDHITIPYLADNNLLDSLTASIDR